MASGRRHLNEFEDIMDEIIRIDDKDLAQKLVLVEVGEWERVNRDLRQHGLPSVDIVDPAKDPKASDLVLMEADTSRVLRETLKSLMRDCDRRQELIKELITTNNQLRFELGEQTRATEKYELRSKDLQMILDTSQNKLKDLENELMNNSRSQKGESQRLNVKSNLENRCRHLEDRCQQQEQEILTHKEKLILMAEEDERRQVKQNEALQKLQNKFKNQTLSDERKYHKQLRHPSFEEEAAKYEEIIKTHEKELKDARKKIKSLENEKEIIKLEMHARPELKDLRDAQYRIKKLERLIKKHHFQEDNNLSEKVRGKFSTELMDLDHLPATHCRHHLRLICEELEIDDVADILLAVHKYQKAARANPKLEQFACDVLSLVEAPGAPVPHNVPQHKSNMKKVHHAVWCEKTWHHVLPTLQYWLLQLQALQELEQSLVKLSSQLLPWKERRLVGDVTTSDLIEVVEDMMKEDMVSTKQGDEKKKPPSPLVLQGIVDHFMKLFDVPKLSGVYARMNDLYSKLGEVHNVLRTLKHLLSLEEGAKTSVIVDTVARLCHSHNSTTSQQLKQLLQTDDLDSVLKNLQEHEEFFPVFRDTMQHLMDILDVNRPDEVVSSVHALQMMSRR